MAFYILRSGRPPRNFLPLRRFRQNPHSQLGMAVPWRLATTACSPRPAGSCPQHALLNAVNLAFIAASLVHAVRRLRSDGSGAAAPEREALLHKPSPPALFSCYAFTLGSCTSPLRRPSSPPTRCGPVDRLHFGERSGRSHPHDAPPRVLAHVRPRRHALLRLRGGPGRGWLAALPLPRRRSRLRGPARLAASSVRRSLWVHWVRVKAKQSTPARRRTPRHTPPRRSSRVRRSTGPTRSSPRGTQLVPSRPMTSPLSPQATAPRRRTLCSCLTGQRRGHGTRWASRCGRPSGRSSY
jgi:hypothetical protein